MKSAKEKLAEAVVESMRTGLNWDQIQMIVSDAYDEEYAKPRRASPNRSTT